MSDLGIISTTLESQLKEELRQRRLIVWLDKDGIYTPYVEDLAQRHEQGQFFAPVIPFRGSYLEMLLSMERYGNGLDPEPLIIHMPGHTEETIRKTPVLEMYRAGSRFRKALDTLIREAATGRVNPEQIETYLNQGPTTLAAAEEWLSTLLSRPQDDLSTYLEGISLEWLLDGLLSQREDLKARFQEDEALQTLADHLHRHTGLDHSFRQFYLGPEPLSLANVTEVFIAWILCVEYVHDLTRPPHLEILKPITQLSAPLRKTCDRLITFLRQSHPERYATQATIVESHLQPELDAIRPEDLGRIDTFQREETTILAGAVQALLSNHWDQALQWAESRTEATSFWLQRNPTRRLIWSLVKTAATLGSMIQSYDRPLKSMHSLREVLDHYTSSAYKIDRTHRHLEQQRLNHLESTWPHFTQILDALNKLRLLYRSWADTLTQDFTALCQQEGFLPEDDLQQRTLYEQVVHPLTQTEAKVAYFVIDAFRYEMATELLPELQRSGITVTLKGRYAELPTITSVGMNALAPVSRSGRLTLAGNEGFKGFKTGEYTVNTPDGRIRAIGDRSVNRVGSGRKQARKLSLNDVCNWPTSSLKKSCSGAELFLIHSTEIDDAGEANVGLATYETWLQQIKSAWNRLKTLGVNEFVFTADHGYLLQDETTQKRAYGTRRDPSRRYVLTPDYRVETDLATVSLSSLNYEGQDGYLLLSKDTAVFDTGKTGATFVHGGNSLQERVIPVLTVSHRHPASLPLSRYLIEAKSEPELLGYNRLRLRIRPALEAQGVLSFVAPQQITIALQVPDRPDIQTTIKDAAGAEVRNQQLYLPVEGDWVEVLFQLKGPRDERVRVEIYHPDQIEQVEPETLQGYFTVTKSAQADPAPTEEPSPSTEWQDSFEDPAIRDVFLHLQQHESITEVELTQKLGSARKVRRFALEFEKHLQNVPFSVRIETTGTGKRYVKQR